MVKVGVIANPAAGKDVRRVVSFTSFTSNIIKANQIRGLLLGIDSTGVDEIIVMPDYDSLGQRAMNMLGRIVPKARISFLEMPILQYSREDTTRAAALMEKAGVGCIVTLGGDGTNRDVAKGTCKVPLVPISSGTNNVFPVIIDTATAGIAAGIIARNIVPREKVVRNHKRLVVIKNGAEIDMALVDAVVLDRQFIGSRAVWDMTEVKQIVCTRAEPHYLGMSRIGGNLHPVGPEDSHGIYVKLGGDKLRITASVLPGLMSEVGIEEIHVLKQGETVKVDLKPSVIAMDGERDILIKATDEAKIRLQGDGPPVVDIVETLKEAVKKGFFKK